jgi:hypothetical protein
MTNEPATRDMRLFTLPIGGGHYLEVASHDPGLTAGAAARLQAAESVVTVGQILARNGEASFH